MTAVDLPSSPQKLLNASRTKAFKSYLLFAICAGLYILPFMRIYMLGTDEGTLDYGAVRIIHGQVFARDFFEVIGPGTFYWLAAFFKLFGISFLATRICLFVTSLGTAVLMYFLSRRICTRYWILPPILLAGTYFGGLWPAVSHHVDSNFFALLAIACIVLWQARRNTVLLLAGGVSAGLTTAILQPKGIFLFCAILIWLLILFRRGMASLSTLGILVGSYLSIVALILFYFWSKGALGDLIYVNFVWPSKNYVGVNSVPYAHGIFTNYWSHWFIQKSGFGWTGPMAAVLMVPILCIASFPVLLLVLWIRRSGNPQKPEVLLYWLGGVALWLAELHRPDMAHLVFGSPLLIVLCIYLLIENRIKISNIAIQLLSISAVCLASFNLICALLLAHRSTTRVGSVWTFKDMPALTFVENNVKPGDDIFAYPYCPRYYFLSSTTNPTSYSILTYNYNTPSQFREVVQSLEQRKVKYVLWDKNFEQVAESVFPGSTHSPPGGFIVEPYLESHYKLIKVVDGVQIMERIE